MKSLVNKTLKLLSVICFSSALLNGSPAHNALTTQEETFSDYEVQERAIRDPFHPIDYSFYSLKSIEYYGESVVLNDGSVWAIRSRDRHIITRWHDEYDSNPYYGQNSTGIFLTPVNSLIYSGVYNFRMVNIATGESVYCNLSRPAPEETWNTIHYIDYLNGYIEVMNGAGAIAQFSLSGSDFFVYINWTPDQRIIFGRTTGYGSTSHAYTLINVDTSTNARCRIYN
jgi:hypothetical protein